MLFNSYLFIFVFAPVAIAVFHGLCRLGRRPAAAGLVLTSLIFYGWWNPNFLTLLIASVSLNYVAGELVAATERRPAVQTGCLTLAIAVNLAVLLYYKQVAGMLHAATGFGLVEGAAPELALPLGISFFTFTQIGYLVDVKQRVAKDRGVLDYVLFVTFFPHLLAGPILHNREMMPQFGSEATYRFSSENLAVGLSIFVIGLAKKCLLADPISATVGAGFSDPSHLPLLAAWNTALCYSLQLYFDFSGYSDMAIGLARMYNLRFPINFNSPYKAASIIDHWQRWHMTLSRYLALYIYNPIALAVTRWRSNRGLGIGRAAQARPAGFAAMVVCPTLITMGLAGVWHGTGLQFLLFGLLHGTYLTINHAWRILRPRPPRSPPDSKLTHRGKILATYVATVVALVFFRAPSVHAAFMLLAGMIGLHGFDQLGVPAALLAHLGASGRHLTTAIAPLDFLGNVSHLIWIVCLYLVVWCLPNTQQIMRDFAPALGRIPAGPLERLVWRPSFGWAMALGAAACVAMVAVGGTSEFLYFEF